MGIDAAWANRALAVGVLVALTAASMWLAVGAGADLAVGDRRAATVQVRSHTCDGERNGSGVVVDGHVITNRHVVDGAYSVEVTTGTGEVYVSSAVAVSGSNDIAVVTVPDGPQGSSLSTTPPAVGDAVVIAGHPGAMKLAEQQSTVESAYSSELAADPPLIFRGNTLAVAGQSGSPAFNNDGEVAALVYASEFGSQRALMIGADLVRASISDAVPQVAAPCR